MVIISSNNSCPSQLLSLKLHVMSFLFFLRASSKAYIINDLL
jgi:hypothetical protein